MLKNNKKVQIYPNLVITLLEVNSLTLHYLHYIVLSSCKAARPAIKEKNQNFGAVTRLFKSYLFDDEYDFVKVVYLGPFGVYFWTSALN